MQNFWEILFIGEILEDKKNGKPSLDSNLYLALIPKLSPLQYCIVYININPFSLFLKICGPHVPNSLTCLHQLTHRGLLNRCRK